MKVEYPRFNDDGLGSVYCTDCPFYSSSNTCCSNGTLCPTRKTYTQSCAIAEGRAAAEKPEAAAPLAAEMTLRDHFAAVALQGMLASCTDTADWPLPERTAKAAYEMADAMMVAREFAECFAG